MHDVANMTPIKAYICNLRLFFFSYFIRELTKYSIFKKKNLAIISWFRLTPLKDTLEKNEKLSYKITECKNSLHLFI